MRHNKGGSFLSASGFLCLLHKGSKSWSGRLQGQRGPLSNTIENGYKCICVNIIASGRDLNSVCKSRIQKVLRCWTVSASMSRTDATQASAVIPSNNVTPVWSAQTWTLGTLFTHIIVTCKPPCRKHKIHLYILHLQAMTVRTEQAEEKNRKRKRKRDEEAWTERRGQNDRDSRLRKWKCG